MRGVCAVNDLLPFIIVGITTGSLYGLAALGLVLTYKTSGVFNFAHGAIAALSAYAFYELRAVQGLPWPVALLVAVVVLPPVLAFAIERITRSLSGGSTTAKIVATVGLQLCITGALIAHYGAASLNFPGFLPTDTISLFGVVHVGIDQLIATGIASIAVLALFQFFRVSSLGIRMRAVVDDPDLLALSGTSAFAVRMWSWLIGSWFAALSGVLLAPQIGLDALLLTLLVVQAFGAAAIGRFDSLPWTFAGGIVIGLLAALATRFVSGSTVLAGLPPSIPFLVLFVVLLAIPRGKLVEIVGARSAPSAGARPGLIATGLAAGLIVAAGVLVPFVVGTKLPVYASALVFVLIFQSLNLLVRTSGQVSLCHAGFVAVGAAAFSHLAAGAGVPWLVAVLGAGLLTVPVGAMVAIPAIRLSGLYLALATFGFALLLEQILYRTEWMFGLNGSLPGPRPAPFASDTAFYYVLLAFAVGGSVLVAWINRGRLGRLLRAMADSPVSLSTLGLGVNVTRVTVFCLSAFLAGVAGALYAGMGQSVSGTPFTAYASLTWLVVLAIAGRGRQSAPVLAAVFLVVVPAYIQSAVVLEWLPVLFGVGAIGAAVLESSRSARTASPLAGARGAERLGGGSPVRARAAEARSRQRVRVVPGKPMVTMKAGSR